MVLIPVKGLISNPREICEDIEGLNVNNLLNKPIPVQLTESEVLQLIVTVTTLTVQEWHNIEVNSMSDFVDRVNKGLNLESYFISYVYA